MNGVSIVTIFSTYEQPRLFFSCFSKRTKASFSVGMLQYHYFPGSFVGEAESLLSLHVYDSEPGTILCKQSRPENAPGSTKMHLRA